jgi:hypothetical protein
MMDESRACANLFRLLPLSPLSEQKIEAAAYNYTIKYLNTQPNRDCYHIRSSKGYGEKNEEKY